MATLTVYPSLDGYVLHQASDPGITWAAIRDGAGTTAVDDGEDTGAAARISSGTGIDRWNNLMRSILLFDTSALGSNVVIQGAVLSLYGYAKKNDLGITPGTNIYSSDPASTSSLVAADYTSLGVIQLSGGLGYQNWSITGYNNFTLNQAGILAISKTGITKLGARNDNYDVLNVEPDWAGGRTSNLYFYFNEKGTIYRPKLVITYSTGAPTVRTDECTNTIAQQTRGHGAVTDLGFSAVTQHGHCWSTSESPTTSDSKTTLGAKPQTGHFESAITGLTPGTTYYIRAYATNTTGTSYGTQVEVTTTGTIQRRHIWEEGEDFHYFDERGVERVLQGHAVGSDKDLIPWLDPFS